jgi:hypothetical protein
MSTEANQYFAHTDYVTVNRVFATWTEQRHKIFFGRQDCEFGHAYINKPYKPSTYETEEKGVAGEDPMNKRRKTM